MSKRIAQLNSLVQQEVATILNRHFGRSVDWLVTVTKVQVADDAESASVWISVLPDDAGESALKLIHQQIRDIQATLNKRLVMKFVPRLTFRLDTAALKADRINDVLDRLTEEGDDRG